MALLKSASPASKDEKYYSLKKGKGHLWLLFFCTLTFLGVQGNGVDVSAYEKLSLPISHSLFYALTIIPILVGALGAVCTVKLLYERPMGLAVNSVGIRDGTKYFFPAIIIPWSDIRMLSEQQVGGKTVVLLHVHDQNKYSGVNAFQRRMFNRRLVLAGTSIYIDSSRLNVPHHELMNVMRQYHAASRQISINHSLPG